MKKYQGCGAVVHRRREDFTWVNDRSAEAADRNQHFPDQLVLGVEVQGKKILLICGKKPRAVSIKEIPAIRKPLPRPKRISAQPPSQRKRGIENCCLTVRNPGFPADLLERDLSQGRRRAYEAQQPARASKRCHTTPAPTENC
jgi:hypothetical protein